MCSVLGIHTQKKEAGDGPNHTGTYTGLSSKVRLRRGRHVYITAQGLIFFTLRYVSDHVLTDL
jgi:hypothetical protein